MSTGPNNTNTTLTWSSTLLLSDGQATAIRLQYKQRIKPVFEDLYEYPLPVEVGNGHEQECVWLRWEGPSQDKWVILKIGPEGYTLDSSSIDPTITATAKDDKDDKIKKTSAAIPSPLTWQDAKPRIVNLLKLNNVVESHFMWEVRRLLWDKLTADIGKLVSTNTETLRTRIELMADELTSFGVPPPSEVKRDQGVIMWLWNKSSALTTKNRKSTNKNDQEVWVQIDRDSIDVSSTETDGREFVKHTDASRCLMEKLGAFK